jgi:twitching motility protein PilT
MNLTVLFDEAVARKASDIHLASGEVPCLRIAGQLVRLEMPPLDRESALALLESFLISDSRLRVESGFAVERQILYGDLMFAGIVFRFGDDGIAATIRILQKEIPTMEAIGFGAADLLKTISEAPRGLVIISGPTGSGKWTTGCSIVEQINLTKAARIFLVEGHPNYRFESKKGLVTTLHVGQDCESYVRALEIAQQADLDVVAVDDIPTIEALRAMLILAETGHLVIVNMHAEGIADAVQRLLESAFEGGRTLFDPPQTPTLGTATAVRNEAPALRRSLSKNLLALTFQRLVPRSDQPGRAAVYEWVTSTPAVREAILSGDLGQLTTAQATDPECRSIGAALDRLVESGTISAETAALHR